MGYRSEIFIKIDKSLEEDLDTLLKEYDLTSVFSKEDDTDEWGSYVKYEGDWLKWYSSYKDVIAIESFIEANRDNAALLGIGEDGAESARAGDIDTMGMYIVSRIEW